jgi:hypothetical protein
MKSLSNGEKQVDVLRNMQKGQRIFNLFDHNT